MDNIRSSLYKFILVTTILSGCGAENKDATAWLFIKNGESESSNYITDIYIVSNCQEGWGQPDYRDQSIAPNNTSGPYVYSWEYEQHRISPPFIDDDNSEDPVFIDIRVCFTSGTCGDKKNISLQDDETVTITVDDEAKPVTQLICG